LTKSSKYGRSKSGFKGGNDMEYETKVILKAIIKILQNSRDLQEAINTIMDIANADSTMMPRK